MFFLTHTATTEIYTLSLHDALPICPETRSPCGPCERHCPRCRRPAVRALPPRGGAFRASSPARGDRKSTRLNSSHRCISYAVFCLKKKKNKYSRVNKVYKR